MSSRGWVVEGDGGEARESDMGRMKRRSSGSMAPVGSGLGRERERAAIRSRTAAARVLSSRRIGFRESTDE